jgi:putative ABC transport system substrate-binding protein
VKNRNPQVPAIYQWREFAEAGGLMSYGPSIIDAYQWAGVYAAQILDGAKPKDLPVLLPDRYELVINVKTANQMKFKIPISMLTRAVLLQRKRK